MKQKNLILNEGTPVYIQSSKEQKTVDFRSREESETFQSYYCLCKLSKNATSDVGLWIGTEREEKVL